MLYNLTSPEAQVNNSNKQVELVDKTNKEHVIIYVMTLNSPFYVIVKKRLTIRSR